MENKEILEKVKVSLRMKKSTQFDSDILDNARKVLAMEILASAQAIDLRGKKKLGKGTEEAYKVIRERTPFVDKDRIMYKDINICEDIIKENLLVEAVEKAIGKELLVSEEIVSDLEL